MSERRQLHHRSASVNALIERNSERDRQKTEKKQAEEEKPYQYSVDRQHRSHRHAPETQDPDMQGRKRRHRHNREENNVEPKYSSQRPAPISTSSHHRSHSSSSRSREHSSRHSSREKVENFLFTPTSPAESARSAHTRPPPLPLESSDQIRYSSSHRSQSARGVKPSRATPELDQFEFKNSAVSPKEEQKPIQRIRTRTRKRSTQEKQPDQELQPPKQQQPIPHFKSFREILAEKPKFASQVQPKPLIGTELDNQFKPLVIKPLTPTPQVEEKNKFKFDNIPDDYRGRRIGRSSRDAQSMTYTSNKNTNPSQNLHENKSYSKNTENDENTNKDTTSDKHVKLSNSAKHRSASVPKKMHSSNQNLWLPPSMEKFKNISIDGEVIIPQKAVLEQSSSSSMLTPITGSNNSEEPVKMTDDDLFTDRELKREDISKHKYKPPKLKVFDAAPVSKLNPPLSATDASVQKPSLKRFELTTPPQIQIAQDQEPRPRRTRRRKQPTD
ncbi:hypothetical protein TVAG_104470 [Trichomonas vaginalis G3]|uniref:Uncharacterized protein n=1 Tax=Trichomonas vaginalis (strain ATCC PRA-98 / G3) TaxID=412133 RepID=A2F695_TRIV3|nr:hypothetical protein TVAGG3_1003360 [Trichomonas vaginalis G3]EAX99566.1 hypothetical protein TVAG_104470 [Trichomonas vaginalis G3]KAI5490952.1 hypothetical protein TVAGG3_1003360 [Trichomonas vaginalis G3]|eukprot:XP_001312496.1 hypothetical protein [Trichomonas vaginalis G3]